MKKKIVALLLTTSMLFGLTACGTAKDTDAAANTPVPTKEATPTIAPTEIPAETPAPVAKTVSPLPVTIDMSNLDNCTVHVSFAKNDIFKNDAGVMQLKVKVYTYDLYDMIDIAMLAEGDTIILRGKEVVITSLKQTDYGIEINGGLDMGGYELRTDEHTVYYEIGYSDVKSYYELGEVTLPISADFIFTDGFDLDKGPVTYHAEDLLADTTEFYFSFTPSDTTIIIENGKIIAMERIYTP